MNIIASDIGPGNTLIDKVSLLKFRKYFDKNGLLASRGKINHDLVNKWMKYNFLKKKKKNQYHLTFQTLN